MQFERIPDILGMTAYAAVAGKWQFLILQDGPHWTASYRLSQPTGVVSASGTVMGPFGNFETAERAAKAKLRELRGRH